MLLGRSWSRLGAVLGRPRPCWGGLGAVLGDLGAVLEPSGAVLEHPWAVLGWSWSGLGGGFGILGAVWGRLGELTNTTRFPFLLGKVSWASQPGGSAGVPVDSRPGFSALEDGTGWITAEIHQGGPICFFSVQFPKHPRKISATIIYPIRYLTTQI